MRSPSIHLTANKLLLVLSSLEEFDSYEPIELKALVNTILKQGKRYSLSHRSLVVDKAKLIKSSSRLVLSSQDDASVFANLLNLLRRKRFHKGISIIKPGSRDWLMVKEITKLANDFCNDFQLKREEGYKQYIGIGLDVMNKFNLMRFNSYHQTICESYEATETIKLDLTPQQTELAHNIYGKILGEKGIVRDYSKEPFKYVYFVRAKEAAIKYGVSIANYIKSQFEGLEWANAVPDPSQLIGEKAIDRLNRYLLKNNIKPGKESNVKGLAEQIKKSWANGNSTK